MKHQAAHGGTEEFRASQQEPNMAEIDTLIERSSLGTPAAKSLRDQAQSLAWIAPACLR